MKRIHGLLLVTLVALLVLPFALPSTASAETIAQKRARAHVIMGQLAALDVKMEKVVERYDAATGKLDGINARIAANKRTLTVTRYDLQMAKSMLQQRVVAMYKQRPIELLDVIIANKSFSSMVDQLSMLHKVSSSDSSMVDSIGNYQTAIVATQKSLATERTAAQKLVAERAGEKASVEGALAARQSLLRGVKSEIAALEAQQAAAARQSAVRSGGYVLTAQPVNPNTSSVVAFAESFVGKVPYVWGGASPSGFDCSGFTMYCWSHFGVGLPHNAAAQQAMCAPVSDPQPGDLVFFGSPAYHVGIYVGGSSMVNAPHTGAMVSYGSVSGASGFGRP
ncbi:MAG TPA: NlpC/P60 family protein [Thermoleophilia bacterium]|nr:NlpC/P60 family protein [Thermoleophilia bacterium]